PDRGSRFLQPGATVRYLPQEPDFAGAPTTLAYVEAGLGPGDDRHQARYLLGQLGLTRAEDPARLSGGEAPRLALPRALAPAPAPGLARGPRPPRPVAATSRPFPPPPPPVGGAGGRGGAAAPRG